MTLPIRTALASYGMSGHVFHGPLLTAHPGFEWVSVLERSKSETAKRYPYVRIARSFEALLADPSVELVVVNTPDHLHAPMTRAALEAGKHVVVEKPFTLNLAEGQELIDLAQSKGLMLSVFQNRRWDGDFLTVQKVVQGGILGRLVEFESHFDRYRNFIQAGSWKEAEEVGTGALYNLGSHLIDQALVLFGMPEAVMADLRITREGGQVGDNFTLLLYYPQFRAILKCGYLARIAGPRFLLYGTEGAYMKHGLDPQEDALKAGNIPGKAGWGSEPSEAWGDIHSTVQGVHIKGKVETVAGNYLAYYDNIHAHLRGNKPLAVTAAQGLDVIRVILAAQESHRLGKQIVLKN